MKTKATLLYLLTLLLTVFSVQPVQAQAVQDALYIFRNDGKFDAFFYGDIKRIEYSKIDTLGVEQPAPLKGRKQLLRLIRETLFFQPEHKQTDLCAALTALGQLQKKKAIILSN